jgi:hypothetical protein
MRLRLLLALFAPVAALPAIAMAELPAFGTPKHVCSALDDQGVRGGIWKRDNAGFEGTDFFAFKCISDPVLVQGAANSSFFTTLNYFAEGRTVDHVEIVKLVLNIHDSKSRDQGRAQFTAMSAALLHALDIAPPPELTEAMRDVRAVDVPTAFGRIRFEVWKVPVERQRLTIEASTALRG